MSTIREDLIGAVHIEGHVLFAGDTIPDGVTVGSHLLDTESGDDFDNEAGDTIPDGDDKPKRGRPRRATPGE